MFAGPKKDKDKDKDKETHSASNNSAAHQQAVAAPKKEIRFRTVFRNCILDVLRARGYKECEEEHDWDFFWAVQML